MYTNEVRQVNWQHGFVFKYGYPFSALSFERPVRAAGVCMVLQHPVVDEMLRIESLDPGERQQCKAS